ncbi:MAG: phage portal protein [Chloroflexia bacterium]
MRVWNTIAAWEAYHGYYKRTLTVRDKEVDPNIRINLARVIVNKSVTALFGKEITLDVTDDEQTGDTDTLTKAQRYLDATWRHNHKMALLQKVALNGCMSGDLFMQLVPVPTTLPRLVNLDPTMCDVETSPSDFEDVTKYTVYQLGYASDGTTLYSRDTWTRKDTTWDEARETSLDGETWTEVATGVWGYPFPPIVHWQNLPLPNSYFGLPTLTEDILHLIGKLNLTLSNWNKTALMHGHPKQYGIGFEASELQTAPDETIVLPDKDSKLGLLEMRSSGEQMDRLYMRLREALNELARLPEVSTGKVESIGVLSGLALHILYQPALELTSQMRVLAGPALEELCQRILTIGGFPNLGVSIEWPELLPGDPELEGRVLEKDAKLGLASRETLARKRGYDPNKERARMEREETEETEEDDANTEPGKP